MAADAEDKSGKLTTLAKQSLIYGLGSVASKVAAIIMLPLYTHYLSRGDYGSVELILSLVAASAIVTQLGLVNSFFRFWFDDDSTEARRRVFQSTFWTLIGTSTIVAGACALLSTQLAQLIFGSTKHSTMILIAAVGIWMQTNYQLMAALFRVQQRPMAFSIATLLNLAVTVAITVGLVVYADMRATGLLIGNFAGSLVVYAGILFMQREWLGFSLNYEKLLRPMLRFGLPMVPAGAALWGVTLLNRPVIKSMEGLAALGVFAVAFKLAQGVMLMVQAFQLSWPAFAHSIAEDEAARRTYARVLVMYTAVMTWAVIALGLLAPWIVRTFTNPRFEDAIPEVLPLAAGAALYGGFFIASIGVARVKKTQSNWVVSALAALIEVGLLLLLVPRFGIEGAAWSVFGAYLSMFAMMMYQSQRHFHVPYPWLRVLHPIALGAAAVVISEFLIPTHGLNGFTLRTALLVVFPIGLYVSGFLTPPERARLKNMVRK